MFFCRNRHIITIHIFQNINVGTHRTSRTTVANDLENREGEAGNRGPTARFPTKPERASQVRSLYNFRFGAAVAHAVNVIEKQRGDTKMFLPILIQFKERSGKCTRQAENIQPPQSRIKQGFCLRNKKTPSTRMLGSVQYHFKENYVASLSTSLRVFPSSVNHEVKPFA